MSIELIAVEGLPEICEGDDLANLITARCALRDGDVIVVAQKAVSKAEGMVRRLADVEPGERALALCESVNRDPRLVELVLQESRTVVRDRLVLIVETHHGYVCANAGIDRSNVEGDDSVVLLPRDCDASAAGLRDRIREAAGVTVGIIVSDTFGRAWRMGLANVALGVAGLPAVIDHRGQPDDFGREMHSTVIAVADEIAAASELIMGKTLRIPAVIVRGLALEGDHGTGAELVRPLDIDLFR